MVQRSRIQKINDEQRILIARDFISRHKNDDPRAWEPFFNESDLNMLTIYYNMASSYYSPSRDLIKEYALYNNTFFFRYAIQISCMDTKSCKHEEYTWDDAAPFELSNKDILEFRTFISHKNPPPVLNES